MLERKKVALRMSVGSEVMRDTLTGIIQYLKKNGFWDIPIHSDEPIQFSDWEEIYQWQGDGIIGPVYPAQVAALQKLGIPVLNISDPIENLPFPSVTFDNKAIGEMAAKHLIQRELNQFAFIGPRDFGYSKHRRDAFIRVIEEKGLPCTTCWIDTLQPKDHVVLDHTWLETNHFIAALKQLHLPIGIFTANDRVAYGVLKACEELGLKSPDDICLVSTDNDEILCNLVSTGISSISTPGKLLGWEIAQVMDRMLQGEDLRGTHIKVAPESVILRNSSDKLAYKDPYVAEAMRYIRNHADTYIDVSDVLSMVPISRRSLERRFMEEVGRGIYKEITLCHIERAKKLLKETDESICQISRNSGFNSPNRFEIAFRAVAGVSASFYRKEQKKGSSPA